MKEDIQHTIGTKLQGQHERDAIHIAVMPVIVDDFLRPGEAVAIVPGTDSLVRSRKDLCYGGADGIIDPFLKDYLNKGDQVWMFLLPNTVSGMRHQWTCPAIDNRPGAKNEHEQWLRGFAFKWNFDYDELMEAATTPPPPEGTLGHYIVARGFDLHEAWELGDDHDLFWFHLETLTGMKFDDNHRTKFIWSCSC